MDIQTIYVLGMIGATGACIVGLFFICATCIRSETTLHNVKIKARKMRMEFDRRVFARNVGTHAKIKDDEEPFLTI